MYISKLSIRNFRNFRNVSLKFEKGVNTIIGENGSGKSNLFQAIRILIDDSMPRSIRFYENDFNRSLGDWAGHWIIIQLEFQDLDSGEEAQSIAIHKIGEANDYDSTRGTYNLFFRPKIDIRRNLYKLSEDENKTQEDLQLLLHSISLNEYETVFTGRGNIDFSEDLNYSNYVGDFDDILFPDPDEEQTDSYGIKMYGISIPNEFACTFAKALRDVESDLKSYKDNPLLNLLRDREKNIPVDKKSDIEEKVDELNDSISSLQEVKSVSQGIAKTMKEAVGETYAPNISIKSELPSNMERLLQSLKLWVGDPDEEGYEGRLWELSLGGANLIYLTLKLLEFEKIKKDDKIANFILIEEPEAHIHNHIQKTLFNKLNKESTQVFITTHSTHISSVSAIGSMNILARGNKKAEVYSPSNNLERGEIMKLERYLDANRTNLLFAKGVILVEGDAEHILIPEMIKKVFGVSLDELGVSIINIGSTGFTNIAQLFDKDRVRRKCSILTDNDISFVPLPEDHHDDNNYERDCRNSQIAGEARKLLLDEFCENNDFVEAFYANYTFEIEFLRANNIFEIKKTIEKVYKRQKDIVAISEQLENSDVAISGKEILRLANKFGKGWFAIMVSENIDHLTEIPTYILQALVYACPTLNKNVLYYIAKYRLLKLVNKPFNNDTNDYEKLSQDFNSFEDYNEALDYYISNFPSDTLSQLIDLKNA
ncbi:ATP-dependent nuclease [Epilithonimonas mollis]|uniref:Predicted ATP-dependent endonuclease of the OLD family, contains P-loop ATPase and TOPRIM domains n=1 Tax=Epilithonimonas mollis TaxID=216903 RepID=A0A1M6UQ70_9FLAO|nr:AAA family ATPase [Epilithonimonas mollis]SHK71328.1 Predicted ATP-dependent endonuclease of the OLD family, contains P-loop ATPase and TOPRIM domains [Epilithonimonas mollis]